MRRYLYYYKNQLFRYVFDGFVILTFFVVAILILLCSLVINTYGLRLAYDNCRKQVVSRTCSDGVK